MTQRTVQQAMSQAMQLHQGGRLAEAEALYRQVLSAQPNQADALHLLGVIALQVNRAEAALDLIRRAVAISPNVAQFHCNLGQALVMSGRQQEALASFAQALALRPDYPEASHNQGTILQSLGQHEQAIAALRRAVALRPNYAEAHNNLGHTLRAIGRFDEAISACQKALTLRPDYADACNNLGSALHANGQTDQAIDAYRRALQLKPDLASAHNNLGAALQMKGQLDEAIASFRKALELSPDFVDALSNLGIAMRDLGRLDEAIASLKRAIELRPNSGEAWNNLGGALLENEQIEESLSAHRRAMELRPQYPEAMYNYGKALLADGQVEQAIASFREAIALKADFPAAHFNLGLALMLTGELDQGFKEYEWRWQTREVRAFAREFAEPRWDGSDLNGRRILLHAEQGFGDVLQFCRYVPLVAGRGGKVIVQCQAEMASLLRSLDGVEQVIPRGQELPPFDVQCPLLSLPLLFGTSMESIPADVPYLRADPALAAKSRDRVAGDHLKVGLIWAGRAWPDAKRTIPLATFAPLQQVPGARFFSLQWGDRTTEIREAPPGLNLVDCSSDLHDFADTAALMDAMDLVITIDTAAAHLAGAMGKTAYVLLPFVADWRWFRNRSDSPWYPTLRLFCQPARGDWQSPMRDITEAVRSFKASP